MEKTVQHIVAILLALLMFIFGMNKFFGFISVAMPEDPIAQQFLGAMFSSYLVNFVALIEIVGGILLIIHSFRKIAWLALLPIVLNIIAFHFAHDFIGNGIWILPSILYIVLGYTLRDQLVSLIKN